MSKINFDRYLALFAGITISIISAWYSIIGLTAIFAGAFWSIVIMGAALELGKIITAAYLYRNWNSIPGLMRTYFTLAVVVLMLITSMGTFGYLSKAHIEQASNSGNTEARIERIDQSIEREKLRIQRAEENISQLDSAINSMISNDFATRGLQARATQQAERDALSAEISNAEANIDALLDEKAPLNEEVRHFEREVGPIRYVAELMYGASDEALLERSVRWIIIILVLVFDPLAVLLIMTTTKKEEISPSEDAEAREWFQQNANAVDGRNWKDMDVVIVKDDHNGEWTPPVYKQPK